MENKTIKVRPLQELKMPDFAHIPPCTIKTSDINTQASEKRLLDYKSAISAVEATIATHGVEIDNLRTELEIKSKYLQIGECSREEIAEIEGKITELSDAVTSLQKERGDKIAALPILQNRVAAAHARLYDSEIVDIQRYYEEQYELTLQAAFGLRQQLELLATLYQRLYVNERKAGKESRRTDYSYMRVPSELAMQGLIHALMNAGTYLPGAVRDELRREGK